MNSSLCLQLRVQKKRKKENAKEENEDAKSKQTHGCLLPLTKTIMTRHNSTNTYT